MSPNLQNKTSLAIWLLLALGFAASQSLAFQALPAVTRGYSPLSSDSSTPEAESGAVYGDMYNNSYFDLSYPLLPDWRSDFKGPEPSNTGYYVLQALRPKGELNGTILLAAQDIFFGVQSVNGPLDLLRQMEQRAMMSTLKIDRPPSEITIASHPFARLEYSGAGLHHEVFATEIRCHVVTVELTARYPEVLEQLVEQMNHLHLHLPQTVGVEGGGLDVPVCIKDYARGANLIHEVEPAQVGPNFTRVPARIIIDKKGRVRHVHVINALPEQARSVQEALLQWTFRPCVLNGQSKEVETGILFEFGRNNSHGGVTMIAPGARDHQTKAGESR